MIRGTKHNQKGLARHNKTRLMALINHLEIQSTIKDNELTGKINVSFKSDFWIKPF